MKGIFERIELKEQEINVYVRALKHNDNKKDISNLIKKIEQLEFELHILEQGLKFINVEE